MRGLGLYGKLQIKIGWGSAEPELVLLQFVSQLMHACCASSTNSEEPEIDGLNK
jgi:hypothetical protein